MKDWESYIRQCSNSELWGFVCLDYFHKLGDGNKQTPSAFIDQIVASMGADAADPVVFHEVLVSVCVQLLGCDFDATMEKSTHFLEPRMNALGVEQLRAIISHYADYRKVPAILERLEKLKPGIRALQSTLNIHAESAVKEPAQPMTTPKDGPLHLFYSYAHEDEKTRDKLAKHLNLLKRQKIIDDWHDRRIVGGMDWKKEIDGHLRQSRIVLLLISSDFITSDYCYGIEMDIALQMNAERKAVVVPVILKHCDWTTARFANLNALPKDGVSVDNKKWKNQGEALTEIAMGIRKVAEAIRAGRTP